MKLVYLHGPPASGKFSIAMALKDKIGAKVFHNHLTIDVAKSIYDYGSQPFIDLVKTLRLSCFKSMAESDASVIIYTVCYDHPQDLPFFEQVEKIFHDNGSDIVNPKIPFF